MEPQELNSAGARSEIQLPDDASTWTTSHVKAWLDFVGLEKYSTLLSSQHEVDGRALLMLNEDDLRLPPLQIEVLGDAKRLWWHISQLQASYGVDPSPSVASNRSPGPGHGGDSAYFSQRSYAGLCHRSPWNRMVFPKRRKRGRHSRASDDASVTDSDVGSNEPLILRPPTTQRTNGTAQFNTPGHGRNLASTLQPEISKLLIAFGYFVLSTWVTAMVMVVVHDRVPDMNTHPPLPDIVLDNVPLIPWAFLMSEVCASLMSMISVAVLIVHKHRFIVMRRFFALAGTIFLLRCVTMLITSLSVPGKHLNCKARDPGVDWIVKFTQAFDIWRGAGMSLQGVRSCGDYMFSGHTVALTLLNHFITEYTNRRMYFLHTFSWLLNMFGIFFILAAHEHYSIDVFIAFYISSRLFLYYHTLANNKTFKEMRSSRTRVWFPMLSYFERNVDGIVPNEYEWPFSWEYWLSIFHQVLPFIKMAQEKLRETAKSAELAAKSKKEFISSRLRRNPVGFGEEGVKETEDETSRELHIQRALARSGLSDTEGDDYLAHGAVKSDKIRKRMKKRNNLH